MQSLSGAYFGYVELRKEEFMRIIIPDLIPVPKGATMEDRTKLYEKYKAKLIELNPHKFNPDGTLKSVWQQIKLLFRT